MTLHLAKTSLIKKFIDQYFKNSIVNLYMTNIVKLSKNDAKYNRRYYTKLFVTIKNINNNEILKIKYVDDNDKSKFKKTLNLDESSQFFSILNISLSQILSDVERAP